MTIGRPSKTVMHSYGAARRALPAQRALLQVGIEAGWQMLRQLFSTTVRNAEADRIAAPALMSVPRVARKLWSAQWKGWGPAHWIYRLRPSNDTVPSAAPFALFICRSAVMAETEASSCSGFGLQRAKPSNLAPSAMDSSL